MKTIDVKVGEYYLYKDEIIMVIERIKGRKTKKRNMQSGELFTGYVCMKKKFRLSNGEIVYADKLKKQTNGNHD